MALPSSPPCSLCHSNLTTCQPPSPFSLTPPQCLLCQGLPGCACSALFCFLLSSLPRAVPCKNLILPSPHQEIPNAGLPWDSRWLVEGGRDVLQLSLSGAVCGEEVGVGHLSHGAGAVYHSATAQPMGSLSLLSGNPIAGNTLIQKQKQIR